MEYDTIDLLSRRIAARDITVADTVEQYLGEISQSNSYYQALSTLSETGYRLLAEAIDRELDDGAVAKPLHGISILVDDLIDVANMRTTYGCNAYAEHVPEIDAMSVRRLRAAGALFPGKSTTSELGLIQEENDDRFICRSPWGEHYVSGGGASGCTVGIAKGYATAAVGMDVGGNVLLPAAFNGVFALRPTFGRIAHTPIYSHGLMFASIALITQNVADCALLMDIVSGESAVDPLSVALRRSDYSKAVNRPIRGLSVALVNALWNAPCDQDHQAVIKRVEKVMKSVGCLVENERPPIRNTYEAWKIITCANLQANHGDFLQREPEKFGAGEWITEGASISATEYINAQKQVYGLRALLREFFSAFDLLIVPAAGCVPFEYGAVPSNLNLEDLPVGWQHYASMCNIGAVSGFPVAHLPMGVSKKKLPVGVFVIAKPGDEDLVLALCTQLEKSSAVRS